jgi:hypothetical protein
MFSLELINFYIGNPRFPKSLSFVMMTLMTMGIHYDVLFYLMSNVELSQQQRNALMLASIQLQTFLMLIGQKRHQRHRRSLKSREYILFYRFQSKSCIDMLDYCNTSFCRGRGCFRYNAYLGRFECDGAAIPPLILLKENMALNPSIFFRQLKMSEHELNYCKTIILFNECLVLLGNSSICQHLKTPGFPEKFFRNWKMMAFIGDKNGKPFYDEYFYSRCEEDVLFLVLAFLASDSTFMKDFMETGKLLETHLISAEVTLAMQKILYSECGCSAGLDESGRLVSRPHTIGAYIDFFSSRIYIGTGWEPKSYWHVLLKTSSRPSLVSSKPLGHEKKFVEFHECFLQFLKNLPDLI